MTVVDRARSNLASDDAREFGFLSGETFPRLGREKCMKQWD